MKKALLVLIYAAVHCSVSGQGALPFHENNQYFLVDTLLNRINNENYDSIYERDENIFIVIKSKKYGFINTSGKIIVPLEFDTLFYYSGHYLWGSKDHDGDYDDYGIDEDGKITISQHKAGWILTDSAEDAHFFQLFGIKPTYGTYLSNHQYGIIMNIHDTIRKHDTIPAQYDEVIVRTYDFIPVRIGYCWGILDYYNKYIVEPQYDSLSFQKDGRFSKYTAVHTYCNGLVGCLEQFQDTYVFDCIIQPQYETMEYFAGEFCFVTTMDGKRGYITYENRKLFR